MNMQKKIYMTCYKDVWMTAVYENEHLTDLYADRPEASGILDRVYIGKVKTIVKNIQAAFVDIGGIEGYYSLKDNESHLYMNSKDKNRIPVPGDEILVQVCKENIKTKAPVLTSKISIAGKYMVLKGQKPSVGISARITDENERGRLKKIFENRLGDDFGFIVRTKAQGASEASLIEEMDLLEKKYLAVLEKGRYLKCFSQVYKEPDEYVRRIISMDDEQLVKICTDIREVYENIIPYTDPSKTVFYEDDRMPLIKLLGLETKIERALKEQVWLKNGGSIVITPTEAMVVIDVNTGKYTGKKKLEDTYFEINTEAAKEIARQVRLRNLSGIIMIDFIDMQDPDKKAQLLDCLKAAVSADPVRTVVVDMTKLNLVEMTRKKEKRPLHEQLGVVCHTCKGRGYIF